MDLFSSNPPLSASRGRVGQKHFSPEEAVSPHVSYSGRVYPSAFQERAISAATTTTATSNCQHHRMECLEFFFSRNYEHGAAVEATHHHLRHYSIFRCARSETQHLERRTCSVCVKFGVNQDVVLAISRVPPPVVGSAANFGMPENNSLVPPPRLHHPVPPPPQSGTVPQPQQQQIPSSVACPYHAANGTLGPPFGSTSHGRPPLSIIKFLELVRIIMGLPFFLVDPV